MVAVCHQTKPNQTKPIESIPCAGCRILGAAILIRALRDLQDSEQFYWARRWLRSPEAALIADALGIGVKFEVFKSSGLDIHRLAPDALLKKVWP